MHCASRWPQQPNLPWYHRAKRASAHPPFSTPLLPARAPGHTAPGAAAPAPLGTDWAPAHPTIRAPRTQTSKDQLHQGPECLRQSAPVNPTSSQGEGLRRIRTLQQVYVTNQSHKDRRHRHTGTCHVGHASRLHVHVHGNERIESLLTPRQCTTLKMLSSALASVAQQVPLWITPRTV